MTKKYFVLFFLIFYGMNSYSKTIKVGSFYFEPLIYQNEKDEIVGLFPDLLNEIGKKEGFEIKYIHGSWAEGIDRIKAGEVDLLTSVAYNLERDSFLAYPEESSFTVWTQLYTNNNNKINNVLELEGKKIGIMKNDFNAQNFKKFVEKFRVKCEYIEFGSFEDVFKNIEDKKVDAGVIPNTVAYQNEKRYDVYRTPILANPFEIYFAVADQRNNELLNTINKYLIEWKNDKNSYYYQQLDFWFGMKGTLHEKIPKWIYNLITITFILLLVFICITIIFKNRISNATRKLKILNFELGKKISEIEVEKEKALEASKAKSLFLSNMSHEIRTPMNGVVGMMELLEMTNINFEQKDYLENMQIAINNLMSIINDILDISKIEAGKIDLEEEEFELESFLGNIMDNFSLNAHKKKLELIEYIEPDIPSFLLGDYGKIRQILSNLISNAIKFTENGEVLVSVQKRYQDKNRISLEFKVKDTGVGIREDIKENIFDVFVQGDLSYTKKYQGTGLGLAISKRFVELMGGEIGFNSINGIGSEFYFIINLKISEKEIHNLSKIDLRLKKVKILLIDDNNLNRKIAKKILEEEGAIVTLVESGQKALNLVEQNLKFDLILLDVHMPEMDGFEVLEELNKLDKDFNSAILMFTSVDIRDQLSYITSKGASGYIIKPLKRKDLYEKIKETLNKKYEITIEQDISEIVKNFKDLKDIRVLLTEDNEINIISLKKILEKYNANVDLARNGYEAINLWEEYDYDIIFMDIQMPEMNGYEATEFIREKEILNNKKTPIIALTAYALNSDKEKILKAGFDEYLTKPIKANQIYNILKRYEK